MTTDLDTEVRRQLEERRGGWPAIALEAGISHSWISQFVRHRIPNPGYATLVKLHDALAKMPSETA
jgi:transcriptional regulator with XRE-family HTH domain